MTTFRELRRQAARLVLLALCTTGAFALPARHALAQQVPPGDSAAVVLPVLRVETSRLAAAGIPIRRTPFAAQVITAEEAQRSTAPTLADLLLRLPGVSFADVMGSAAQPDLMLRGFGVSPVMGLPQGLSVFVDGVRINEPDASQVNFDLLPVQGIERIEIVRGPSGPFGKNTLGGAINVVTRRGIGAREGWFEISGGSNAQAEARALLVGEAGGLDYHLSARYHRNDGWRDHAGTRLRNLFTRFGWSSDRTDLWLSYTAAADSLLQAGSLPRSWLADPATVPERFRTAGDVRRINFTGGDAFVPRLHFVAFGAAHQVGERTRLSGNLFHRRNDARQFNANFIEPDIRIESGIRSSGGTVQLSHTRSQLTLVAGAEYSLNLVDLDVFEQPNENHPALPAGGERSEDVGTREHNIGGYAQARWEPSGRLALTGALRFDYVELPFHDRLEPENGGRNHFRQLTGTMGVDILLQPGVVLLASYGRGFRAPVLMELACADPDDPCPLPYELGADPPLDPVTTDTWQGGVRFGGGSAELEVIGYWAEVRNDIFFVQPPETRAGYFENIRRTRRQGVELAASMRPRAGLTVHGNLGLARATFRTTAALWAAYMDDDDDDHDEPIPDLEVEGPVAHPGDEFPMVPRVRLGGAVDYAVRGWRFGFDARHTGTQWLRGDEGNDHRALRLRSYTTVQLRIERTIRRATLYAVADNLLDVRHETFGVLALNRLNDPANPEVEPFVTPGAPRRVVAGVRVQAW